MNLKSTKGRLEQQQIRNIERVPNRIFAIGDIHGCNRELKVLLNYLKQTCKLSQDDLVVFIGDYVDRGANVRDVLDQLIAFQEQFPNTICLKGNHEDMLLAFLGFSGEMGGVYLANGGTTTCEGYGLNEPFAAEDLLSAMGEKHVEFLRSLDRLVVVGPFIFVHAGLDPLSLLEEQRDEQILWIRDNFIMNTHRFGKIVVFGHTPFEDVVVHLPYKVGIDTGLVFGNMLSCVELRQGRVYQVQRGSNEVQASTIVDKCGQEWRVPESDISLP